MNVFDFFSLTTYIDGQTALFGQVDSSRADIQPITALRFLQDDSQVALVLSPKGRPLTLEQAQTRLSQVGDKASLYCLLDNQAIPVLGFHQNEDGTIVIK
ncbi:hypothetical protein [Fructobacillus parabroussonetiae]|uniref:Uncharacterized protein n=1 Tax=Fructobacillus parabroussonetiae TaxID=2713174 RepID=A0ABS5R034_9LACO|nr:hypothetical protein [Fructobacillus parabroussonetiae]MBS9337889.1 hypothetical protein [Fructobacillus parabroussonetiae]